MSRELAAFPVRVYWEDTDAGGIVYHANYLKFMERARSSLLSRLNVSQNAELSNPQGVLFVVADAALKYRRAALLGSTTSSRCTRKSKRCDAPRSSSNRS